MRHTLTLFFILLGCGAPVPSASDVDDLFSGSSASLDQKTVNLCDTLKGRDEPPSTKNLDLETAGCVLPGRAAVNYNTADKFYFTDFKSSDATDGETVHKAVRGQVWLNKNLLDIASLVGKSMAHRGDAKPGEIKLPNSAAKALDGLVEPKITLLKAPELDIKELKFSMKLNIHVEGAILADHDIQFDGQVIDNMIAVTVQTTVDRPFEVSLLKNFKALVLVVPHAGDVYVDAFIDVNVNRLGLDSAVEKQISSFLATGLKSMVDGLMLIEQ